MDLSGESPRVDMAGALNESVRLHARVMPYVVHSHGLYGLRAVDSF